MNLSPEMVQNLTTFAPIVFMVVIFYFLLYRPQKKQQKTRMAMLESLKKGDRVVTVGGVHGTITAMNDKIVTLRVAEKVEIDFSRGSIDANQTVQRKNGAK